MPGGDLKMLREAAATADVTSLLLAWSSGDRDALEQLTPLVYREMRQLAHGFMRRERSGHSLQTTALVNAASLLTGALAGSRPFLCRFRSANAPRSGR